jgi:alpha-glucosidase
VPITSGTLGRLNAVSRRGADLVFSFESSDLILTPMGPNVIRHTWVPTHWRLHKQPAAQAYAVVRTQWPLAEFGEVVESRDMVRIRCADLVIEASRDPFHLRYLTADGRVLLQEARDGGLSWSYWDYALRYQLGTEDHFYGMGQPDQLEPDLGLDHRGHRREIWNQHTPPAVTVFPAFVNPRGYGLLVDNPYKAVWDLGHGDPRTFSYSARGGALQYYFFHADGLPALLRTYLELTGFPPHPPRWVFGLLQSRYGYRNRAELGAIARTFRAKGLPCDALILDLFWFAQMGDLAFNAPDWPDAPEMIARLGEQGFRVMVIEEPYITEQSSNYAQARAQGLLAKHYDGSPYSFDFWPGRCALIDFSNPAAREWWTDKHRALLEMGIAGWWTDLNEPTRHFEDMAHYGGSAAAVHNLNALWMHQAIARAHERYAPRRRSFILSRSAYPGSQRYGAALWSGDVDMTFAALRKQVAVGLSAGMAGIPFWGSDIGGFGFAGKCTAELYIRWFQFGAFCPLCRPHGDQTELREPWQFGPQCEAICRTYLELRYRLLPYIYSCAHQACTIGLPLMRPLALEFPDDPQVVNMSDQYLFGPDLLVAPVLEQGATQRTVYLPAGGWIDFRTDQIIEGPRYVTVPAPLDSLPLFIRRGAIIPMGPDMQYSGERPLDPLTLEIYRGGDRSFILYEDDGETTAYQTGAYAETGLEVRANADSLLCLIGEVRGGFAGYHPKRSIVLNVHQQGAVKEVNCNGAALAAAADRAALERMAAGWWWSETVRLLRVKFRHTDRSSIVRVS